MKMFLLLSLIFGINSFNLKIHPLNSKIGYIKGLNKADILNLSDNDLIRLKLIFSKHPLLVFPNIEGLETKEFLNFVKNFDDYADEDALSNPQEHPEQMLQPFDQFPECKHVAPRGNKYLNDFEGFTDLQVEPFTPFKDNYIWHTDILGHDYKLPNVVTGFYMKKSPVIGGETDFISGEDVYSSLNSHERQACKNILVEINRQKIVTETSEQNYAGTERTEVFKEADGSSKYPISFCREGPNEGDKILIMPTFIEKIVGWSVEDSRKWIKMFMNKHVLPHRVSIQWRSNDLAVFNNRHFMHSSTPANRYLDNDDDSERFLLQTFIPTTKPIFALKPDSKNVFASYNNHPRWVNDPETSVKSSHLALKYAEKKDKEYKDFISSDEIYCLKNFNPRSFPKVE